MIDSSSKRVCNPLNRLPVCSSMYDTITNPLSDNLKEKLSNRVIPNCPYGTKQSVKSTFVLVPYGTAKRLTGYPVRMLNYDGVERSILDRNGVIRAHVNVDGYIIPDSNYMNKYRDDCQSMFGSDEYVAIKAWDEGEWLETYEPSLPQDTDFKVLGLNMIMFTNVSTYPAFRICP